MKLELESVAGFRLAFDPLTLDLEGGGGMTFAVSSRTADQLRRVLETPDAVAPNTDLYRLYALAEAPPDAQRTLDRYDLTYSLVLLPPGRIGREFVKTAGHYHPLVPGTHYGFPEVYTQLHGRLLLLLQRRNRDNPEAVDDCVLADMQPGFTITIPPDYAHVLVNPTDEPALMAGLYGSRFQPDYDHVQRHRGLAYRVVADGDTFAIERNSTYADVPPLRRLGAPEGTPFESVAPGVPVWRSFIDTPDRYRFLTDGEALLNRFGDDGNRGAPAGPP